MGTEPGLPLAVCVLPEMPRNAARTVRYPRYLLEAVRQIGFCHAEVDWQSLPDRLPSISVLLTVGESQAPEAFRAAIGPWLEQGGAWIAVAGTAGCADMLGVETEPPAYSSWGGGVSTLGEGYLRPIQPDHPILKDLPIPLHYFNGAAARLSSGPSVDSAGASTGSVTASPSQSATVLAECLDKHQRATGRVAVSVREFGRGIAIFLAPDIPGTLVRVQQGVAVTRDGVPSDDGTAPIDDLALKSGDGGVLDWVFDRQEVPGAPGLRAFLEPVAEWWRTMLARALVFAGNHARASLPLLWYWPRNLNAVGHISHDTDGNGEQDAGRLLEVLAEAHIRSTWCVILPGYPREIVAAIRDAGHELATHFDAMSDGCEWSEDAFSRQWCELADLFGAAKPTSNKNHYLRWEGDTELFDWCAARGILLDQSKGASKTGEAGYNFGFCRPCRPVDPSGRLIDVFELPTPSQDLCIFGPIELLRPIHRAARDHYGVFHLLFHPAHIRKEGVAEALKEAVRVGAESGMEFWTAAEIANWERRRLQALWSQEAPGRFCIESPLGMEVATILVSAEASEGVTVNGFALDGTVERWGFSFRFQVLDLPVGGGKPL